MPRAASIINAKSVVTGRFPFSISDSRNSHIVEYCHCLLRAPNGLFYGRQVMDIR